MVFHSVVSKRQILKASAIMTMKNFFADPQWIVPSIIAPLIFTLVSLFLFRDVNGPLLLYAVLGGGLMGMWGTTVYGSGNSIQFDRWNGTLESTLSAPGPLMWISFGRVIWYTLEGVINGFIILGIGFVWFRVGVSVLHPIEFSIATILTFISLSSFGLLLSSIYVLTRKGGALSNGLEIPVYIATGTMFPVSVLPFIVNRISLAFGPTWGIDAIRKAALGSYTGQLPTTILQDLVYMTIETVLLVVLSLFLFGKIEAIAKKAGTLDEY